MLPKFIFTCFLFLLISACTGLTPEIPPAKETASVLEPLVLLDGHTLVTGKVTKGEDKDPVAGIEVSAWPVSVMSLSEAPPYVSEQTTENGLYQMQLPPGRYYFIAEGEDAFSYYGRNPVTVSKGGLDGLNISLVKRKPAPAEKPEGETGIYGRLTFHGEPLAGAIVTVYVDLNSQLKGMGLGMTAPTDAEGFFHAEMPPGTYYLLARKRVSGGMMGPLRTGDYFGYLPTNPIQIVAGQLVDASIAMLRVPENVTQKQGSLFGKTSIHGKVVDVKGEPVAGIRVLLYDDPMMLNRPLYVSQPTAEDGSYVLSFPKGGVYFLAARDTLGGPPRPGQRYGRYEGNPEGSVQLKTGEKLADIELVVEEMQ